MSGAARAGCLAALLLLAGQAPAAAQSSPPPLGELRWLDPASAAQALAEAPRRLLATEAKGGRPSVLASLGELAFRSPRILGGDARIGGLSCDTCHPNGGANRHFFVTGLSDRPGNVDVSHVQFNRLAEDGLANPVNIPSLRGIKLTPPYGRDGRIASLREFIRSVIVTEFDGDEPPGWLLDALLAYLQELSFLPGAPLGPDGRLGPGAGAAARRGEALFARPFANRPALSCAGCHPPDAGFADGRRHDVGSGGKFDSPTLLNLVETPPYFHDGRFADLEAVLGHFDSVFGLGLAAGERADLVAYLDAVGAAPDAVRRQRLGDDLARVRRFLAVVAVAAQAEDARIGAFAAEALRVELGRIHARLPHEGGRDLRAELVTLSLGLRDLARRFEAGAFIAARADLQALAARAAAWGDGAAAEPGSLYEPAALQQRLGVR